MRSRALSILTTVIAASTLSLIVAACGSNSPRSGGHPSQARIQQLQQDAVRFADCMRSHGVTNFPDPTTSPRGFKESLNPSATHSPAFESAATPCQHLLPRGGQSQSPAPSPKQIDALLAFARCMRSHGFPSFPDPTSTGELTHQMVAGAGINVHLPATVQAADGCAAVTHGVITKAAVARFAAGH